MSPKSSSDLMAELRDAAQRAAQGRITPEERAAACQDLDRIREAIRAREGTLDLAVPLVREMRGGLPDA